MSFLLSPQYPNSIQLFRHSSNRFTLALRQSRITLYASRPQHHASQRCRQECVQACPRFSDPRFNLWTKNSGTTRPTSTTLASPRKGRHNCDGLGTTTDRPAADQMLKMYSSADAVKFLRTSKDCSDYDVCCHYFWVQLFMSARDFNPEERKNLFDGTIPGFAYPPAISAQISQGFDDVYYTYQAYFAAKVESYAQKWLQTPAGSSRITAQEQAK